MVYSFTYQLYDQHLRLPLLLLLHHPRFLQCPLQKVINQNESSLKIFTFKSKILLAFKEKKNGRKSFSFENLRMRTTIQMCFLRQKRNSKGSPYFFKTKLTKLITGEFRLSVIRFSFAQ